MKIQRAASAHFQIHTQNLHSASDINRRKCAAKICGTSKLFFSVLLPGSPQIAASYLPPQARLRAFTVGLWFRVQARLRPSADEHRRQWWRRRRQQQEEQQLRQTEKYEKNIHWQSCPQNTEKRLQTPQKKVRQLRPGSLIVPESLSFISL